MKTRRILLTVAAVVVLCLLMTVTAFADSTPIKLGDTVTGTFTDEVTEFEYSFTLPSSGHLDVNVSNDIDDRIIYWIKEGTDGDQFTWTYVSKGDQPFEYELAAGEYTIGFGRGLGSQNGDFSFTTAYTKAKETFTDDNNSINAISKSDALAFGTKVYGHLALNDGEDWYKIVLPSSGKLTLKIHTDLEKQILSLQEKDGDNILWEYMGKGDETKTLELEKGTYYLNMRSFSGYGKYNFTPTFTKSGETYTYENNTINLVRSKAAIPFNTVIKGL